MYEKESAGARELKSLQTTEGRITFEGSTPKYEYFLKDHLGNVRSVFTENAGTPLVLQETNYYPFGKTFGQVNNPAVLPSLINKNLFNSKELQNDVEFGLADLNLLDIKFRFYDFNTCRFNSIDRLAEKYPYKSPYDYAENRPTSGIDLDGLEYVDANKTFWGAHNADQWNRKTGQQVIYEALNYHNAQGNLFFGNMNLGTIVQSNRLEQLRAMDPLTYGGAGFGNGTIGAVHSAIETYGLISGGLGISAALKSPSLIGFAKSLIDVNKSGTDFVIGAGSGFADYASQINMNYQTTGNFSLLPTNFTSIIANFTLKNAWTIAGVGSIGQLDLTKMKFVTPLNGRKTWGTFGEETIFGGAGNWLGSNYISKTNFPVDFFGFRKNVGNFTNSFYGYTLTNHWSSLGIDIYDNNKSSLWGN
jgi:RHS repeat-associated protein